MGGYLELVLQHHLGVREALGDAPPLQRHNLAQSVVAARVDVDGVGRQSGFGGHVMGHHGVLDLYEVQRSPGRVGVVGSHGRNLVSHEADPRVQDAHVRGEPPPLRPWSGGGRETIVERSNDGPNSRQPQCFGPVHAHHIGVRVRAAENRAKQHTRQLEVGGVLGLAGEFRFQVPANHTGAGNVERHELSPRSKRLPPPKGESWGGVETQGPSSPCLQVEL